MNRCVLFCAFTVTLALGQPTFGQVLTPPKDSRLVVDNVLKPTPAKVIMNMDRDVYSGTLPTGIYYMELLLSHYVPAHVPLQMVALFHSEGGHMVLNDAAYNRVRHASTGNPWKEKIAALQKAGVSFELCSFTAYTNKWVNSDLLPGVKVDNDVLLRLITLTQDGYVQIHP